LEGRASLSRKVREALSTLLGGLILRSRVVPVILGAAKKVPENYLPKKYEAEVALFF